MTASKTILLEWQLTMGGIIMKASSLAQVDGREVELSNLTKILWPDEKYTKAEMINYYAEIFPVLAPHLKDRPLVFTRYPDGIQGNSFYQKNVPLNLPPWIETYPWESKQKIIRMLLIKEKADIVWLANLACIEIHPWLSRKDTIENPDFMIFDLDPSPGNTLDQVKEIAQVLKNLLDTIGLRSYLKTSGAQGLHIYVPLNPVYSYARIRETAGHIAETICYQYPQLATVERTVSKRGPRIYVDYMQNVIGKTICAPYSIRPRPGAPVSAPVTWEELPDLKPVHFTIKTILERVSKRGDLFAEVLTDKQELTSVLKSL